jgi:hypothetical protein
MISDIEDAERTDSLAGSTMPDGNGAHVIFVPHPDTVPVAGIIFIIRGMHRIAPRMANWSDHTTPRTVVKLFVRCIVKKLDRSLQMP